MSEIDEHAPARIGAADGSAERRLSQSLLVDMLIVALPALMFLEVRVVGRLFATEIALLAIAPVIVVMRGRALTDRLPATILLLGLVWLGGQVVTDLVRDTPFDDYSRGWAKIAMTLLNFATIHLLLYRNRRRITLFALGVVIGFLLDYWIDPSELARAWPWKFGYAFPVTLALVIVSQQAFERRVPRVVSTVLFLASAINLYMGFRSLAGICFLAAVYLFAQWRGDRVRFRLSPSRVALLGALGLVAAGAFLEIYGQSAQSGLLGADAKAKYERQTRSDLGVVLGGRTGVLVAIEAIKESPVIGHGSWAKDDDYARMMLQLQGWGPWALAQPLRSRLIPSHSHIFGAWVEAGIVGAVFWGFVLWLTARVLLHLHLIREPLTPLVMFVCFILLWDILFSPFGAERRFLMPYYFTVMIFAWNAYVEARRARARGGDPPP